MASNASRTSTLEDTASLHDERLDDLEGNVEILEDDMTSNAQRITNIESDYATEGYVVTAVVAAAAAGGVVDGAISTLAVLKPTNWGALAPDSSLDTYVDGKILLSETVVHRPFDWISYPPLNLGGVPTGESTTLKSYTDTKGASIADQKVSAFKNGDSSYLKLRNTGGDDSSRVSPFGEFRHFRFGFTKRLETHHNLER